MIVPYVFIVTPELNPAMRYICSFTVFKYFSNNGTKNVIVFLKSKFQLKPFPCITIMNDCATVNAFLSLKTSYAQLQRKRTFNDYTYRSV